MAKTYYAFNSDTYEQLYNTQSGIIKNYSLSNLDKILENTSDKLRTICLNMLDKFDVEGNDIESREKSLSKKIKDLQQFTAFSNGSAYWTEIGNAISKAEKFDIQRGFTIEDYYKKYLWQVRKKLKLKLMGKEINGELVDVVYNDLLQITEQSKSSRKLKLGQDGIWYEFNSKGQIQKLMKFSDNYYDLTKTMRTRFREALSTSNSNISNIIKDTKNGVTLKITDQNMYDFFQLTSEEMKDYMATNNNQADLKVVNLFKNKLLSLYDEYNGKQDLKPLYKDAINTVINTRSKNKDWYKRIFGGKTSSTNLLGTLGEIQALFYMLVLFKGKTSWVGGKSFSGQQPHADLVVQLAKKGYGIQVKNVSIKDTQSYKEYGIQFAKFNSTLENLSYDVDNKYSFDNFTPEAKSKMTYIFGQKFDQILTAIFTLVNMQYFNVPYKIDSDTKKYQEISESELRKTAKSDSMADHYLNVRNKLFEGEINSIISKILSEYITGLVYMQANEQVSPKDPSSNALFLIGGEKVITSYSIVKTILENLEQAQKYIKLTRTTNKKDERTNTIVEFFNSNSSKIGSGFAVNLNFNELFEYNTQ